MTTDTAEARRFGLGMAAALTLLGLLRWTLRGAFPAWLLAAAMLLLALALVTPVALRGPAALARRVALVLDWVITRVLLCGMYFLVFVPGRLLLAVLRKDLLERHLDPNASSYWQEAEEQPVTLERYLDPF